MTQSIADPVVGSDVPRPALAQLATMPRVDLMPPEIAEIGEYRRLKTACAAAVVASAVVVGSLWLQGHNDVQQRQKDVTAAQDTKAQVQRQVSALAPVAAVYASVESAQQLLVQTLSGEVRWSNQLRDLSLTVPANVWLTNMSVSAKAATPSTTGTSATGAPGIATITFQGVANRRDDVATWLDTIAKQKGYVDASYSTTPEQVLGSKVVVNFTSTVTVTTGAESGRYTTPNGG